MAWSLGLGTGTTSAIVHPGSRRARKARPARPRHRHLCRQPAARQVPLHPHHHLRRHSRTRPRHRWRRRGRPQPRSHQRRRRRAATRKDRRQRRPQVHRHRRLHQTRHHPRPFPSTGRSHPDGASHRRPANSTALGLNPKLRHHPDGSIFITDENNVILDCACGSIPNPAKTAADIRAIVGVVEHGLFLNMASLALIAGEDGVREVQP